MRYINDFGLYSMTDSNFNKWIDATLAEVRKAKTEEREPTLPNIRIFGAKFLGYTIRTTDADPGDVLADLDAEGLPEKLRANLQEWQTTENT